MGYIVNGNGKAAPAASASMNRQEVGRDVSQEAGTEMGQATGARQPR